MDAQTSGEIQKPEIVGDPTSCGMMMLGAGIATGAGSADKRSTSGGAESRGTTMHGPDDVGGCGMITPRSNEVARRGMATAGGEDSCGMATPGGGRVDYRNILKAIFSVVKFVFF